jgi:hypothetical protein
MSAFDNYETCNKELNDKDKEILEEISILNPDFINKVDLKPILGGKSKNYKSTKKIKGGASTQAKILAGIICALLMGGSSALLTYVLLQPGVSNMFGVLKPCNGDVEQIITYLASFTTGSLTCAQRQTAFDTFVQKLQTLIVTSSGLTAVALHDAVSEWVDAKLKEDCKLEDVQTSNNATNTEEVVSESLISGGRSRKNRNKKNNQKRKTNRRKRTNRRK